MKTILYENEVKTAMQENANDQQFLKSTPGKRYSYKVCVKYYILYCTYKYAEVGIMKKY